MGAVTAPVEVVVDTLVLSGVAPAEADAVVEAFRRHLGALLTEVGGPTSDSDAPDGQPHPEQTGRALAAAVVRALPRSARP